MQSHRIAILVLGLLTGACAHRSLTPERIGAGGVRFYCPIENGEAVFLVGDFNGWQPAKPMARQNGFAAEDLQLRPGSYAFACQHADGKVAAPKDAPAYVDDGFGGRNGLIVIGELGK